MNPVPGIDDRRALLLRQKDLLGVFHGNRLAIHSNLERTEGACLQSGFQVGEFHRGKSKPGRSEGKPQPVRRIEKTDRLKNGASVTWPDWVDSGRMATFVIGLRLDAHTIA